MSTYLVECILLVGYVHVYQLSSTCIKAHKILRLKDVQNQHYYPARSPAFSTVNHDISSLVHQYSGESRLSGDTTVFISPNLEQPQR